jgi:hypothetical protein
MNNIVPDTEALRVVHLINLQNESGFIAMSLDDLRAVLHAALPNLPESAEACPDAHCRLIDHDTTVKTYYINEAAAEKLWEYTQFIERIEEGLRLTKLDLSTLKEIVNLLAVACESRHSRAWRIEQNRKTEALA